MPHLRSHLLTLAVAIIVLAATLGLLVTQAAGGRAQRVGEIGSLVAALLVAWCWWEGRERRAVPRRGPAAPPRQTA